LTASYEQIVSVVLPDPDIKGRHQFVADLPYHDIEKVYAVKDCIAKVAA
jgi:hypothetical protein